MNDSFAESVSDICGKELCSLAGGYKYSVFSGRAVVAEGSKGIEAYSQQRVKLYVGKKTSLEINGENLSVKCMGRGFCVVTGKVESVRTIDA